MKLKIFGANLRDQSKGAFVVHAADCADCKKLEKIGERFCVEEHASVESVSRSIWSDMINEGSMTVADGLSEIHFAPCCAKLA
jgi:L-2-hydroxyglutarate oxidase LhgO